MNINKTDFFNLIKQSVFRGKLTQPQVEGCEIILDTCIDKKVSNAQTAYILATAYHETAHTMQPVRETLAKTDAEAIRRLDNAFAKGQLKWVKTPYWKTGYFGRGYVQLTHKYNYEKAGKLLKLDLVNNPPLTMKPEVSVEILVQGMIDGWFTGKKLNDYINSSGNNFIGARRIVNGTDQDKLIAGYAASFLKALNGSLSDSKTSTYTNIPVDGKKPLESSTVAVTTAQAAVATGVVAASGFPGYVTFGLMLVIALMAGYIISERLRHSKENGV
jgi:hypothetical protein